LRVLLLLTVRVKIPEGVLAVVVTVRMEVPAPPNPAELATAGIVTPSFTRPLKPAFGETVTATGLAPGESIEIVVWFSARL
jgi:hypothetical protein